MFLLMPHALSCIQMVKMKLENKSKLDDIDNISTWLISNFPKIKDKPISIEVNAQGKVNHIEIGYDLSKNDIKKIKEKYPELST